MKKLTVAEKLRSLHNSFNCYSSTSTNAKSPKPIKIIPASATTTTTIKTTTTHLQEYIILGNSNVGVHGRSTEEKVRAVKLTATKGRPPKRPDLDPGNGAPTH